MSDILIAVCISQAVAIVWLLGELRYKGELLEELNKALRREIRRQNEPFAPFKKP